MGSMEIKQLHVGYAENGKTSVLTPLTGQQILLHSFTVSNNSGAAVDAGMCVKLATASWKFGSIVAASTPDFSDKTSTIQAGTAATYFTTTNNDGFLVQADEPFGLIGLNVSQAPAGGTPAYSYQYYSGSSYSTLTTVAVPTYALGTNLVVFQPPVDWAVGTTAAVGGDTDKYSILVRATTAPTVTAGQFDAAWVAKFLYLQRSLGTYNYVGARYGSDRPLFLNGNQSLMPYFGGTASAQNSVDVSYSISR